MKKQAKWVIAVASLVIMMAIFIYSLLKPLQAEVITVKPQTVAQTFKEQGTVVASKERNVHSDIEGKIQKIYVQEGQKITKEQLLASIDTQPLQYQIQQLQGQKESLIGQENMSQEEMQQMIDQLQGQLLSLEGQQQQTEKTPYLAQVTTIQLAIEDLQRQIKQATNDYNDLQQLLDDGFVSQQEVNVADNHKKSLENQLKQTKQQLNLLEEQAEPKVGTDKYFAGLKSSLQSQIHSLNLKLSNNDSGTKQYFQGLRKSIDVQIEQLQTAIEDATLVAPITGEIKEILLEEGDMVSTQSPLIVITAPQQLEIEVYVLTEDILYIKEGMNVSLIQNRRNGDYTFSGKVKSIAGQAEQKISALGLTEQRVKTKIIANDTASALKSGYTIDVEFTILQQENRLAVPKAALFPYNNGNALFVLKNGKATIRNVTTGLETNDYVVITKGLQAGDQVIKNPQLEGLEEGKRIQVSEP